MIVETCTCKGIGWPHRRGVPGCRYEQLGRPVDHLERAEAHLADADRALERAGQHLEATAARHARTAERWALVAALAWAVAVAVLLARDLLG